MTTRPAKPEQALATVNQGKEFLNLSRSAIYGLMRDGTLPYVTITSVRRIRWTDLRKLAGEDGGAEQ